MSAVQRVMRLCYSPGYATNKLNNLELEWLSPGLHFLRGAKGRWVHGE